MPNARVLMATAGMLVVRVKPVDPDNWEDGVWPLRMAYLSQNPAVFNVSIHTERHSGCKDRQFGDCVPVNRMPYAVSV